MARILEFEYIPVGVEAAFGGYEDDGDDHDGEAIRGVGAQILAPHWQADSGEAGDGHPAFYTIFVNESGMFCAYFDGCEMINQRADEPARFDTLAQAKWFCVTDPEAKQGGTNV